jgi:hypothetical protein
MVQIANIGRSLVRRDEVTCELDVAAVDPVITPVVLGKVCAMLSGGACLPLGGPLQLEGRAARPIGPKCWTCSTAAQG